MDGEIGSGCGWESAIINARASPVIRRHLGYVIHCLQCWPYVIVGHRYDRMSPNIMKEQWELRLLSFPLFFDSFLTNWVGTPLSGVLCILMQSRPNREQVRHENNCLIIMIPHKSRTINRNEKSSCGNHGVRSITPSKTLTTPSTTSCTTLETTDYTGALNTLHRRNIYSSRRQI